LYGVKTLDAQSRYNAKPSVQTRDDFNSAKLMTNVFVGVATVGAIVGVVLWVTAPSGTTNTTKDAMTGLIRF
jgi:hypothetical protein